MLIPAIHGDPSQCVALPDSHVVKLIAETLQIVSTAAPHVLTEEEFANAASCLVAPTHPHHPYTKWAASSRRNLVWLIRLGTELCGEKKRRWPDNGEHCYAANFRALSCQFDAATVVLSDSELPRVCVSAASVPDERHRQAIVRCIDSGKRARAFQLYYHFSKRHLWRFGGAAETHERRVAKRQNRPAMVTRFVPEPWASFVLASDE